VVGAVAIGDPIKNTTPGAVTAPKHAGIRVVMLTGDNATTARAVAAKLGISEVAAERHCFSREEASCLSTF